MKNEIKQDKTRKEECSFVFEYLGVVDTKQMW